MDKPVIEDLAPPTLVPSRRSRAWRRDETDLLLRLVHHYAPALFGPNHRLHRSSPIWQIITSEIARRLPDHDWNDAQAKLRFTNLRTFYYKDKKTQAEARKDNCEKIWKPTFEWFWQMDRILSGDEGGREHGDPRGGRVGMDGNMRTESGDGSSSTRERRGDGCCPIRKYYRPGSPAKQREAMQSPLGQTVNTPGSSSACSDQAPFSRFNHVDQAGNAPNWWSETGTPSYLESHPHRHYRRKRHDVSPNHHYEFHNSYHAKRRAISFHVTRDQHATGARERSPEASLSTITHLLNDEDVHTKRGRDQDTEGEQEDGHEVPSVASSSPCSERAPLPQPDTCYCLDPSPLYPRTQQRLQEPPPSPPPPPPASYSSPSPFRPHLASLAPILNYLAQQSRSDRAFLADQLHRERAHFKIQLDQHRALLMAGMDRDREEWMKHVMKEWREQVLLDRSMVISALRLGRWEKPAGMSCGGSSSEAD